MSEARTKARELLATIQGSSIEVVMIDSKVEAHKAFHCAAPELLAALCTEGDALESKVNALEGEVRDEWIRRRTVEQDRDSARAERDAAKQELETHLEAWEKERATTDAVAAANVQLTATVRQLQHEKGVLEASLADAREQYAATTTEQLVLLSAYAMNYGAIRVTEEFALQLPVKVSTYRRDGVYEVVGGGLPNDFPSRLGVLVMLAARRVTATASEDDVYALLQALGCPAICVADPVKLGTAATELADLVGALRGPGTLSRFSERGTRAETLARCCRMLIPLLDEATQREVNRRMMGGLEEPTRVQTHDRDCLCQRCLDEAGRGR